LAAVFSLDAPDCAAREDGAHNEAAARSAKAVQETQRRFISRSSCEFLIRHLECALAKGSTPRGTSQVMLREGCFK
jgi:hypothetical protein